MSARHSIRNDFMFSIILALTGTVLVAATGVAAADTPADQSIAVEYRNSDLNSREASVALYERITTAASEVCTFADQRDLAAYARYRACKRAAIDRAVDTLHSSQLAAVHSDRNRKG